VKKATSVITFPRGGAGDCVLARIEGTQLRIAHLEDLARANQIAADWNAGEFRYEAGRLVDFSNANPTKEAP
jgi:hypothetical protein